MPFGFNLPGPFTWHAQDRSSKKLLRAHRRQNTAEALQELGAHRHQRAEDAFHRDLIAARGPESAAEALAELSRLRSISAVLAEPFEANLRAEVDAYRAAQKNRRRSARQADYDTMLAFYTEIARRHTSRATYTRECGFARGHTDARAMHDAWKAVQSERKATR